MNNQDKKHILVKYERSFMELATFLGGINPNDIISITESTGYTIIYRSNSPYDWKYKK